MTKTKSDL